MKSLILKDMYNMIHAALRNWSYILARMWACSALGHALRLAHARHG